MCGETESQTLTVFQLVTHHVFLHLVRNEQQSLAGSLGQLLCHPARIACACEIEYHNFSNFVNFFNIFS